MPATGSCPSKPVVLTALLLVIVVASSGCLTGFQKAAESALGVQDWRPDDPTQEEYLIRTEDGLEAPHPFTLEGDSRKLHLSGMDTIAEVQDITVTGLLREVGELEANARGTDYEEEEGQEEPFLEFRLEDIDGTLMTSTGEESLSGASVWVQSTQDSVKLEGEAGIEARSGSLSLSGSEVSMYLTGVRAAVPDSPQGSGNPPPSGWLGPLINVTGAEALVIRDVTVEFQANGTKLEGDLQIAGGSMFRLGANSLTFDASSFDTDGPVRSSRAVSGYKTHSEHGYLTAVDVTGDLVVAERPFGLAKKPALHVSRLDSFDYDPASGRLSVEGGLVQIMENRRPWIQAEVSFSHPEQDEDGVIRVRAPPGERYRTLLGVEEVSGVGSAMDILPDRVTVDGNATVSFGLEWYDERVYRDSVLGNLATALSRIFVIPEGTVSLGPGSTAYLDVRVTLPEDQDTTERITFVLHARNAAVMKVEMLVEPDEQAATTDVRQEGPAAPIVLLFGLIAGAVLLGRHKRRLQSRRE